MSKGSISKDREVVADGGVRGLTSISAIGSIGFELAKRLCRRFANLNAERSSSLGDATKKFGKEGNMRLRDIIDHWQDCLSNG
jgi:hypothetical protein